MRSERNSSSVSQIFERIKYAAENTRPLQIDTDGSIIAGEKLTKNEVLAGRFKTLFVNDKDTAIRTEIMKNMIKESMAILPQDQEDCEKLIQERVPSLGQISHLSTAIGEDPSKDINTQWNALKGELLSKLQGNQLQQRQNILDEMSQLLPAEMELINIDGEVFKLRKTLSDKAQADILDGFIALEKDPIAPSGIHAQAQKDLNRAIFRFIYLERKDADDQPSKPVTKEFGPGNGIMVLNHLKSICGNDPTTLATVSKMIGQRALAPLIIALATDFAPRNSSESPPVLTMKEPSNAEKAQQKMMGEGREDKEHLVYIIEQTGDGRLLIGAEYGCKGEVFTDATGRKSEPVSNFVFEA